MKVLNNISLQEHNTFGIKSNALKFTEVETLYELTEILTNKEFENENILILGGGSNILFTQDFDGLVIKIKIRGFEVLNQDDDEVFVKVGAGEMWHDLVLFALDNNWGGLENLSLIPGTVGAAPIQNIGAYGVELKDSFEYLEAIDIKTLSLVKFEKDQCKFGYRDSIFKNEAKGKFVIISVVFKLSKTPKINTTYGAINEVLQQKNILNPTIRDVSEVVCAIRQSKLPNPAVIGNAGSFFKNPNITFEHYELLKNLYKDMPVHPVSDTHVKIPAGWLIEQCGWKGKTFSNYGVHKNQALVLVNYGGALGKNIVELSKNIQNDIYLKYQIELEVEVNFI